MIDLSSLIYKDNSLQLELIQQRSGAPVILFSSGFMTDGDEDWREFVSREFSDYQLVRIKWKSGGLQDVRKILFEELGTQFLKDSLATFAASTIPLLKIPVAAYKIQRTRNKIERIFELWNAAKREAELAGRAVGRLIKIAERAGGLSSHSTFAPIYLIGHSLGARLMANCLYEVADHAIDRAIFLGGAVDFEDSQLEFSSTRTKNPSLNVFSLNDEVLRWLYTFGNQSINFPIGINWLEGRYLNVDATDYVLSHTNYCGNVHLATEIKRLLGDKIEPPPALKPVQRNCRKPGGEAVKVPRPNGMRYHLKISKWIKQEGQTIQEGEVIAILQLDSNLYEVKSQYNGTLAQVTEAKSLDSDDILAYINP